MEFCVVCQEQWGTPMCAGMEDSQNMLLDE